MKNNIKLMQGDNILSLKKLPDNSIDSVVTDPPYGLSFMNKKWDHQVPSIDFWKEVYRVLKPGGHVLSFGGTRTYHRMTVNIEDAGFEIRDQIMWLYGSGFPKSHNIGKSVDKIRGTEREVVGVSPAQRLNKRVDVPSIDMNGREVLETKGTSEWEGWGTALKPANEPICVARKPLSEKTIAENVLNWGTGGINIDGCRVKIEGKDDRSAGIRTATFGSTEYVSGGNGTEPYVPNEEGRFPANIILDEEAGRVLDEQTGILKPATSRTSTKPKNASSYSVGGDANPANLYSDKGGASRFFYCPKVSKKERNAGCEELEEKENKEVFGKGFSTSTKLVTEEQINSGIVDRDKVKNNHPTVKPIALMAYLCRLVTPPNGIVLDPFMGSGSTGCAAIQEGFRFVGMELDEDYFEIATKRIEHYNGEKEGTKI
jgi:DNA modification methylase